jgi:hypothetical protein
MRASLIVGLLVGLTLPSLAAEQPRTRLFDMKPTRVHFTMKRVAYNDLDYRFNCRFLTDKTVDESVPVQFCATDKDSVPGQVQILTRDVDGVLQAVSITADTRRLDTSVAATVMDVAFFMYLSGKVGDDVIFARAKSARVRLLNELKSQNRVVYRRDDAVITAYLEGPIFHMDIDRPALSDTDE